MTPNVGGGSGLHNSAEASRNGATGFRLALWAVALAMACLIFLVAWKPTTNPAVHNGLVIAALLAAAVALVRASLQVATDRTWLLVGVHAALLGLFVRLLPAILLGPLPLHDGYYYLVSTMNITSLGTLDPVLVSWYGEIEQQLNWPVMHLLAAQLTVWTGIPPDELSRYVPALLGCLTYFAIGLLAYEVFQSWRIAAVAGTLGSFADSTLYYQMEYHPQGMAILSALVFLCLLLASRRIADIKARLLLLIVGGAFLFTHHASTLIMLMIAAPLLALPRLGGWLGGIGRLRNHRRIAMFATALQDFGAFGSLLTLLLVATIALHTFYSDAIARAVINRLTPDEVAPMGSSTPALWLTILRSPKYALLLLTAIGMWLTLRRASSAQRLLIALALVLLAGAAIAQAAIPDGSVRLLAVTYPIAAIFASVVLVRIAERVVAQRVVVAHRVIALAATGGAALFIAAGIANSQGTSLPYLMIDPPRSAAAWYGGALPRTDRMALAGDWIRRYDSDGRVYAADFATLMGVFYYGRVPTSRIFRGGPEAAAYCAADVLVVDYDLEAEELMDERVATDEGGLSKVYDNGSVAVYQRPKALC